MPKPDKPRLDQEKMGIFSEMSYISVGDKYPPGKAKPFKPAPGLKRFEVPFSKEKAATQDGYFTKAFGRVMEKEAYHDAVAGRRKHRIKESKRNIAGPFVPSHPTKEASGTGNYFGTLGGKVPHFSAEVRPRRARGAERKNFFTNPPQKGTGFGYANVLIGKVPAYKSDPLDMQEKMRLKEARDHREKLKARGAPPFKSSNPPGSLFDSNPNKVDKPQPLYREEAKVTTAVKPFMPSQPAKDPGGCKAGMFTKFPPHMKEAYKRPPVLRDLSSKVRPKNCPLVFQAVPGIKTTRTTSVLQQNVSLRINPTNHTDGVRVLEHARPPKEITHANALPTVTV